ncbi:MAG: Cell division protein DivIC (FtsB), stabilizes FtsL against RasP cleavage [uncultured Rubrobacteraceae bacterium]|uniref:Cell division protein DivIC (FtsB), stabilizes FtsL against RasP cleavage n=1 Tax=uncultured Rubrobacteraceae bacterium TaxID=349277 RepID=A0A6J4QLG8_9ACTN|nr:MAG: Cell division protein DivIC (FtsB), stabilizes FtsL against RasP cleavage [uncultured Rubrobacteraceae bacterium]
MSPSLRLLKVILYAAFVGLLLASYLSPLQEIIEGRSRVFALQSALEEVEKENAARERIVAELETPEGVERAARERYGMIKPGEKVYIVPDDSEE